VGPKEGGVLVITGGNPAMWELGEFVTHMQNKRAWLVQVETQGSLWKDWLIKCMIVASPKGPGMKPTKDSSANLNGFMNNYIKAERNHGYRIPELAFKVVIFDQRDFEFAAELTETYPDQDLYLSVGNEELNPDLIIEDFRSWVLDKYKMLLEDWLQDPRLAHAKFTPQLHTLIWGNQQGV
jgi:7-carboxy-7-deazaguanine synthase